MKPDIRIPTTGDKKLPMEPSNKREKNADEQDAFERLVEDHDDSKTELAAAKTAESHESTQSPKILSTFLLQGRSRTQWKLYPTL